METKHIKVGMEGQYVMVDDDNLNPVLGRS